MADEIDIANDRILADIEKRIAAARKQPVEPGLANCEECEDDMPPERQAIGARLCIECARRAEHLKKLYSR